MAKSKNSSKKNASFTARTGKAIKKRPVASAAIATGAFSAVAATVAGFLAFKKSGKTFSEFSDDIATKVKDGLAETKTRASDAINRRKDGVDDKTQAELSQEAMTLKTVSKRKAKAPKDPVVDEQTKVGAISY